MENVDVPFLTDFLCFGVPFCRQLLIQGSLVFHLSHRDLPGMISYWSCETLTNLCCCLQSFVASPRNCSRMTKFLRFPSPVELVLKFRNDEVSLFFFLFFRINSRSSPVPYRLNRPMPPFPPLPHFPTSPPSYSYFFCITLCFFPFCEKTEVFRWAARNDHPVVPNADFPERTVLVHFPGSKLIYTAWCIVHELFFVEHPISPPSRPLDETDPPPFSKESCPGGGCFIVSSAMFRH